MLLLLSAEESKGAPDSDLGAVASMAKLEPGRVGALVIVAAVVAEL